MTIFFDIGWASVGSRHCGAAEGRASPPWPEYTADLRTRPIMPDFAIRAMHEDDRRALYRFIKSLGPGGQKAPEYLPPGQTPPLPYMQMVLPPPPAAAPPAPPAG